MKANAAADWSFKTGDQSEKGGLAAAGGAQQPHKFTALQAEIDVLKSPLRSRSVIAVPETIDLDRKGLHRREARKCSPIVIPLDVNLHPSSCHHT